MFKIFKTPLAEADLKQIWRYTFDTWGEAQADQYLEELDVGIRRLAANPKLGRSRDTLRPGYRSLLVNHHFAYYRIVGQKIEIVRVLHGRMDPERHLL